MILEAIVEMPKGTIYKYEINKATNELVLDRTLKVQIPFNYGYLTNTLSSDGDALDIFILSKDQIIPKTKVKVLLLKALLCLDGQSEDNKMIGCVVGEELNYSDPNILNTCTTLIVDYLRTYKSGFQVTKVVSDKEEIEEVHKQSRQRHWLQGYDNNHEY